MHDIIKLPPIEFLINQRALQWLGHLARQIKRLPVDEQRLVCAGRGGLAEVQLRDVQCRACALCAAS